MRLDRIIELILESVKDAKEAHAIVMDMSNHPKQYRQYLFKKSPVVEILSDWE